MSKELIENLFLPDGGPYALSSAMAARSGSGKTTLLTKLVTDARKNPKFKETRFISQIRNKAVTKDKPFQFKTKARLK